MFSGPCFRVCIWRCLLRRTLQKHLYVTLLVKAKGCKPRRESQGRIPAFVCVVGILYLQWRKPGGLSSAYLLLCYDSHNARRGFNFKQSAFGKRGRQNFQKDQARGRGNHETTPTSAHRADEGSSDHHGPKEPSHEQHLIPHPR